MGISNGIPEKTMQDPQKQTWQHTSARVRNYGMVAGYVIVATTPCFSKRLTAGRKA
jgi:hypothetical protein